ncbi:hypothetical protein ABG79_00698 [Caloramator mitchellensis]|uniref:Uncharacterized protein n=1 Tax=Caloramator mitchellensis TaxID=908809 RepID=A0A0R3JUX2_CALMK|nr:hypothetical protein [Caloramator mitchellensis]KRQ87360.1 hypothetical protein ABG79_00698 [Caloramator mitchellensis]
MKDNNPDLKNPISILPEDKYINVLYDQNSRAIIPKELSQMSELGPIGFALMNMGKRPLTEDIDKRY